MRKIFKHLITLLSVNTKVLPDRKTLAQEIQNPKTDNKAYLKMPMAFDFTAYFYDKDLENNEEEMSHENPKVDTNNKVMCMNEEKCNEMLYSSTSQQFECCTN